MTDFNEALAKLLGGEISEPITRNEYYRELTPSEQEEIRCIAVMAEEHNQVATKLALMRKAWEARRDAFHNKLHQEVLVKMPHRFDKDVIGLSVNDEMTSLSLMVKANSDE